MQYAAAVDERSTGSRQIATPESGFGEPDEPHPERVRRIANAGRRHFATQGAVCEEATEDGDGGHRRDKTIDAIKEVVRDEVITTRRRIEQKSQHQPAVKRTWRLQAFRKGTGTSSAHSAKSQLHSTRNAGGALPEAPRQRGMYAGQERYSDNPQEETPGVHPP